MKKRIFSILFALVLSFSLIPATPVMAATINVPGDYSTIQAAVNAADSGDTIIVGAGEWAGATVDKAVEIRGEDGAKIVDGPSHGEWKDGFRLVSGSSGATISHFTFQGLELPIYGWGPDDVTIEHNKIYAIMQGITNWDGDGWVIRQNVIEGIVELGSGGLGIVVGSRNSDVSGNLVTHNKIVADIPDDHVFSVGGILLCTDERYGWTPGVVTNNKIVHNRVKITGPISWAIALQVIGLSEYPPPEEEVEHAKDLLYGNIVGFNNLRGSDSFVECLPVELVDVNTISRNLGEDANRGRGAVPANVFNPV